MGYTTAIYIYVYLYVYYRGYHGLGCNPKQIVLKMISNSHNGTVCNQKTAVPHEPFISIHTQWTISCTSCESLGCLPTPALQKTFSITILPVYIYIISIIVVIVLLLLLWLLSLLLLFCCLLPLLWICTREIAKYIAEVDYQEITIYI